jgi:hypothetical protein
MTAKELRIGNWVMEFRGVDDNGPEWKQYEATISTIERLIKKDDRIEPIPLTGEWLIRFGFKEEYHEPEIVFVKSMGYGAAYYFSLYHNTMFKDIPAGCNEFHISEIEYVHQLQNLYFALTGEEL